MRLRPQFLKEKIRLKYKNSTCTNYANVLIAFVSNTRRRSGSDKNFNLRCSLQQLPGHRADVCNASDEAGNPTCFLSLRAGLGDENITKTDM